MKFGTLVALAAQGGLLHTANAQSLAYVTELVTECFDPWQTDIEYGTATTDTVSAPYYTGWGPVDYSMPACECGCPTCSHTSVYSTNYPIFCSTGVTDQTYTITETYHGMPTLPTFAEPTECPYGFTTEEVTCTVCGDAPITQTMTYPSGGCPYDTGLQSAYPTLAPTQAPAPTYAASPHGSNDTGASPAGAYPAQNDWSDEGKDTTKTTKTQSVTLSVNGTHPSTAPAQGGSYPSSKPDTGSGSSPAQGGQDSYPSSKPETGSGSSPAQGGQDSYPAAGGSPAAQASQGHSGSSSSPVKVSSASRLGGMLSTVGFVMVLAPVLVAFA
ncbi:hypothetical protein PFICI_11677 [Pestalotiopsis fici W106-1]|uniref:Uncharacterized protein n=1 Tax=Pestalotiopsis fici (strain W106-1 / CGMCC3.15140) TaxID=1229662 RepID=W3WR00_PESFW|nr:uncharacterized protein PFICI_11677 [Pestalotiopsis fici W106-1]ETS76290.1 hypothetical protein PFICI_11677 [Pestalotiopsis fici W106-1]